MSPVAEEFIFKFSKCRPPACLTCLHVHHLGRATQATTIGAKLSTAKLPRIISLANITPASGALNVALMPAPAPAATRIVRCRGESLKIWPAKLPSADPI